MDTSLFRILFTKFYSFRNSGLQVTDIQKKKVYSFSWSIGLATKWLRILSLGGIDKICNHLVANPIITSTRSIQ